MVFSQFAAPAVEKIHRNSVAIAAAAANVTRILSAVLYWVILGQYVCLSVVGFYTVVSQYPVPIVLMLYKRKEKNK